MEFLYIIPRLHNCKGIQKLCTPILWNKQNGQTNFDETNT